MLTLTLDPFEISGDPDKDSLCVLAEASGRPFNWVKVLFLRVARLASGNDVIWRIWTVCGNRDEVLLDQNLGFLKQRWSMSAVGTSAIPIVKSATPISGSKSGWERSFSGITKLSLGAGLIWVLFIASLVDFTHLIWIVFLPSAYCFLGFSGVRISPALATLAHLLRMILCPFLGFSMAAIQTVFFYAIRLFLVLSKFGTGLPNTAIAADATDGQGMVKHGNLLKLSPSVLLGAGLGNPVVRRVIKPSQAHAHYTTERSA